MKRFVMSFLLVVMLCCIPAHAAYAADDQVKESGTRSGEVSDWATLFGWLSDINGKLGLIYYDVNDILTGGLTATVNATVEATIDAADIWNYPISNNITVGQRLNYLANDLSTVVTRLTTANSYMQTMNTNLSYIEDDLQDVIDGVNNTAMQVAYSNSYLSTLVNGSSVSGYTNLKDVVDAINGINVDLDIGDLGDITVSTTALENLVNRTNNHLSIIEGQLDRILLYLVVSDVQNDLIGDFDWIGLGEEISALSEEASDKIPFSALGFFVSLTQLSVFNTTPSRLPEITIPFNFSGSNQTLTISNALMNQAQPYIHFAVLLMFMYCLAVVTMRFIYYD